MPSALVNFFITTNNKRMDENGIFYCATTHNQFYKDLVTNYARRKII